MPLQGVKDLRQRWEANGVLAAIERSFDKIGFTKDYVGEAVTKLVDKSKVVKDNIWGMIEIDGASLRLLDSPLVQRMRGVHQLGLTYLTYPTAEHSRFVHSLGMYSVISRFLEAIQRTTSVQLRFPQHVLWNPNEHEIRLLKHAAILHDAGHLPFSHALETIFHANRKTLQCAGVLVDDFLFPAEDCLGKSPKLAECLSIGIVLTDRFANFYSTVVQPQSDQFDTMRIAALIGGIAPNAGDEGVANLISGTSIDADKIDYINRDAAACGIPVGVDVSRLFLRSAILRVCPQDMKRLNGQDKENDELVFVVNSSGLDSIEEIGLARTALFHRVYYHQTTRNAERLLGHSLIAAANYRAILPKLKRFKDAAELWAMGDLTLLEQLSDHPNHFASLCANRLRSRSLPKRACSFGRNLCTSDMLWKEIFPNISQEMLKLISKQTIGSSLESLRASELNSEQQALLEQSIRGEAEKIRKILKRLGHDRLLPSTELAIVSLVPMATLEANRSDCIILENQQLTSTASTSITDEQMEALDITKARGYVLCDAAWREIVFIAARKAIADRKLGQTEISFEPAKGIPAFHARVVRRITLDYKSGVPRVGLDIERVEEVANALKGNGFFDECPRLLPASIKLETLSAAASKLSNFCGQGGWSVSKESIIAFLTQFPPKYRQKMCEILAKFHTFDRVQLTADLGAIISSIDLADKKGFIVAASPDSGNVVRMQIEQELTSELSSTNWSFRKSLRDVLSDATADDHIVFCDDNVTSGFQLTVQFKKWFGAGLSDLEKNEHGIEASPLAARDAELLKKMTVSIVTSAGTVAGKENLRVELAALGMRNFMGLHYRDTLNSDRAMLGELENFLEKVGTSILCWVRHKTESPTQAQTKECKKDALGYNGTRALSCSLFNVPVGTLTPLWCPGIFNNSPWIPLLIRRGYLNHLVV